MVTTKYNFKLWLRKAYPEIMATAVYGIPAYILDKAMKPEDMYEYKVQQLPSGQYIVFIGLTIPQITEYMEHIIQDGIPSRRHDDTIAPTTFACFEAWMRRTNREALHRTYCAHSTPHDCFHTDQVLSCTNVLERKSWYLYEFKQTAENPFIRCPHIITENGTIAVLIKASQNTYVSKRRRFLDKFQLMQPIYEQLIVALAIAEESERGHTHTVAKEHWEKAQHLCEQYMSIQFEKEGIIDIDEMKEAYRNGTIGLFTRDIRRLHEADSEGF